MSNPLISIIIVNWNGRKYLRDCLPTLMAQAYPHKEVIVVDNGSSDDSVRFVKEKYAHKLKLIEGEKNLGFAEANNIGILQAKGKYVLVLNNDTEMDKNCLDELLKIVEADEKIGMCAPKILMQSDRKRIDSAGLLLYPDGLSRGRGRLEIDCGQYDELEEVIFPSGCCGLYRRRMLEEIGLFDKNFFMCVEDTDLGLRAKLAGWRCIYVPSAVIFHKYSATMGEHSSLKAFLVERNRIWTIIKIFPLPLLLLSFYYTIKRYAYQLYGVVSNTGSAAIFSRKYSKLSIAGVVFKAYFSAFCGLPKMLKKRKKIQSIRKVGFSEMHSWFKNFGITAKELALKE